MRTVSESKVLAVPNIPANPDIPPAVNNAIVAQLADNAATNNLTKNGILTGAATVNTSSGKEAVIGQYGLTPEQLAASPNGLKPGMEKVMQRQLAAGVPLSKACPPAMWKQGDLTSFVKNPTAQAAAQQSVVSASVASLSAAIPGAMKSPSASAGLVVGITSMGAAMAKSALSSLKSNPIAALGMVTKFGSSLKNMINTGNLSASAGNLKIPDIKGAIASAFGSLKSKATALTASLTAPQNLAAKASTALSEEAKKAMPTGSIPAVPTAADVASKFSSMTDSLKASAMAKVASIGNAANAAMGKISDRVASMKNAASNLAGKISSGFAKPPEVKLPEISPDVSKLAGDLSSGGDIRVPKIT